MRLSKLEFIFLFATYCSSEMAVYRRSMPYRRPLRKSVKARSRKTSTALTSRGISVPRNVFGFPRTLTTLIRYNDTHTIQSSSGAVGGNVFRMNSVYDPDFTGLGHQPLYFDQFTPVYEKYVVLGATIQVDFSPLTDDTDITTAGPWTIGIAFNNSNSWSSSTATLTEQNKSITTMIGRDKGTSIRTLKSDFDLRRDLGKSWSDDDVQSFVNTNPSSQMLAYVWCSDQNLTSGSVKINTTITYRVKFFEQKQISSS